MRLIRLAVILTLSLILAPVAAEGQQAGKIFRIGMIAFGPPETAISVLPFRQRLLELGYVEGPTLEPLSTATVSRCGRATIRSWGAGTLRTSRG